MFHPGQQFPIIALVGFDQFYPKVARLHWEPVKLLEHRSTFFRVLCKNLVSPLLLGRRSKGHLFKQGFQVDLKRIAFAMVKRPAWQIQVNGLCQW